MMILTDDQYAADLRVMIEADAGHLAQAILNGNRVLAHQFVDSIIDNRRALEDLEASSAAEMPRLSLD